MEDERDPSQGAAPRASGSGEVLDLCVIGGGVAGTTAALFAREVGLATAILDAGDFLGGHGAAGSDLGLARSEAQLEGLFGASRARDFAVDLLAELASAAPVQRARQRLLASGASCHPNVVIESVVLNDAGSFCVRGHASGAELTILANALLLTIDPPARAVELDAALPEGTANMPGRMVSAGDDLASDDLAPLLDRPALVLGGSVAAARAVVDLSNAKRRADAESDVYWLHASSADPELEAVGASFLAAWLENRNIHSLAGCEVLGSVPAPHGGGPRVALRLQRGALGSRPDEGVLYEFDADCILKFVSPVSELAPAETAPGPDAIALASALGARIEARAGRQHPRVDEVGRLSLPGLYIAGDALGVSVLRCPDFDAGSEARETPRRPGGLTSVCEALRAVEDLARRAGRSGAPSTAAADRERVEASGLGSPKWKLVSLRADGSIDASHGIREDLTEIGRRGEGISIPDDDHMADHHASLVVEDGELFIVDSGAGSGVWLRVNTSEGADLAEEDQVWVGAQILVAIKQQGQWSLAHYGPDGRLRATHPVTDEGVYVGRGSDLVLDRNDAMLSRRHAQLRVEANALKVYDRGARNGTFVKIRGAVPLAIGDEFRIATKCFRLEPAVGVAVSAGAAAQRESEPGSRGGEVRFDDEQFPIRFALGAGKTILQGYIEAGGKQSEPIAWECQTGGCGLCGVEIVRGAENLQQIEPGCDELATITKTAGISPDPARHRLACMTCIDGDVVLRRLG